MITQGGQSGEDEPSGLPAGFGDPSSDSLGLALLFLMIWGFTR